MSQPVTAVRRRLSRDRKAHTAARIGYVAKGVFNLLLAYLVLHLVTLGGPSTKQANTQGALALTAQNLAGKIALGVAAAGFVVLGVVRICVAWRDADADTNDRVEAVAQGVVYLVMAAIPIRYLAGHHSTGSEKQQKQTTGKLLGFPGGQVLVGLIGVGVLVVCVLQIRSVLNRDYADGMQTGGAPGWVRRLVRWSAVVGIAGRALMLVPIGIFLIVAAVTYDPQKSRGLDGSLLLLAGKPWGVVVLALVALALVAMAVYSFLEAAYRDVSKVD